MINLLPDAKKREIQAGRTNGLLVRYIILTAIMVAAFLAAFAIAYMNLQNIKTTDQKKIDDSQVAFQQLNPQVKNTEEFRKNLQVAQQIFAKQVNYTTVIGRISSQIPDGVVLDEISLNDQSFGKPITLTARSKNEDAAIKLKDIFTKNDTYYHEVNLGNITFKPEETSDYKYSFSLNVTLDRKILE